MLQGRLNASPFCCGTLSAAAVTNPTLSRMKPSRRWGTRLRRYGLDVGHPPNDFVHSYQYDAEGNLLKIDGVTTASYAYSPLNRRVETKTNGGATIHDYFYNLNGQRSAIWDGPSRTLFQAQTYWGTTPVAYYSGGSIHYQHQDWQGTERARTSYNGAVEGTYNSLPFGDGSSPARNMRSSGNTPQPRADG